MQFNSWLIGFFSSALILTSGCCKEASGDSEVEIPSLGISNNKGDTDKTDVDLAPLPLTMRVPKGGMGGMDMSLGEKKSVTVDIGDGASLNIQPLSSDGIEAVKKSYEKDTILHPFKRFAKEEPNGFVVEFESDGKTGFVGVRIQDVSGTKYTCKTTGLDGVKTVETAEKHLSFCANLKGK